MHLLPCIQLLGPWDIYSWLEVKSFPSFVLANENKKFKHLSTGDDYKKFCSFPPVSGLLLCEKLMEVVFWIETFYWTKPLLFAQNARFWMPNTTFLCRIHFFKGKRERENIFLTDAPADTHKSLFTVGYEWKICQGVSTQYLSICIKTGYLYDYLNWGRANLRTGITF